MTSKTLIAAVATAIAILAPRLSQAQAATTFNSSFTGASDSTGWTALDGACLTAGNNTGDIPACVGLAYYGASQVWVGGATGTLPDSATANSGKGNGSLRLTNGCTGSGCNNGGNFNYGFAQAGGIISGPFAAGNGIQVTFKTFTYEGNSLGNGASGGASANDGADGLSFFILDGTQTPPYNGNTQFDVGAFGGSLGYTCTNELGNDDTKNHPGGTSVRAFDGVYAGYLGLGIDEYGNFLNPGDNTATGPGQYGERIGLRGSGSVNWYALQNTYGTSLFPSSWTTTTVGSASCSFQSASTPCTRAALAVHYTCTNGYLSDYGNNALKYNNIKPYNIPDYNYITNAYTILPSTNPLANESATKRSQATPITYSLKITQNGILSVSYSYNGGAYTQVLAPQNVAALIGALPSTVRFGFAGSTGGGNNVHEIACFEAGPPAGADTSVGVNQKEASKINTGTQAFLAFYDPTTWTGDITANEILYTPGAGGGTVTVNTAANWDASCNLTGVPAGQTCLSTGASGLINAQTPASRVMLTWNGTQGIPFEWGSLNTTEQNTLDAGDTTPYNSNRLQYLRGVRGNEINSSGVGLFRARVSVLGDIVDSSPTWVGYPDSPYANVWTDRLYPSNAAPENGSQTYGTFAANEAQRLNVVYVGANDGFLHGFEAGNYDANHNFVTTSANDGKEVFAYMPGAVLQTIHNSTNTALDFSNAQYAHNFFVDATPDEDDLFYAGAWHTWVVGGLGAGGSALYAIDVTNPANFTETNAGTTVIGEWTPSTISCTNVTSCGSNLGNTYGEPLIRRLHNGMWGVIFGNGYGSSSGDAGIYIMTVDPTSGAKTFYYLGTGQSGNSDGIAFPSAADLDGDNVIDYVYAGDIKGNVWRFDLTSSNPLNWAAGSTPVFTDPSGHPISTKVVAGATLVSSGSPRVILNFGTGRKIPQTATAAAQYATGTQTIYGIWDWNMSSWNAQSATKFAYLTTGPSSISLSNLQQQVLSAASTSGVYDDTSNTVCWGDGSGCGSNPQYGWYLQLPNSKEQLLFNPLLYQGTLYFNSTVPPSNSPLNCSPSTETGYTYAVSGTTGGVVPGLFPNFAATDANAAGENTDPSGSPFVVLAGGGAFVLTQSTAAMNNETTPTSGPFTCTGNVCETPVTYHGETGQRLTWIEKR